MSSTSPPRSLARTAGRATLSVLLLGGVADMLFLQAAPDAPVRGPSSFEINAAKTEQRLALSAGQMGDAAGTRDVVLHFPGPPAHTAGDGLLACEVYYFANLVLYPRRAMLGRGDRVVNDVPTLWAADVVPDSAWLRAHGVAFVADVPIPPDRLLTFRLVP